MKKEKGFTLIELIAVLIILAIIALIVAPLMLNIVKKAKMSANKRSVDAYGKAAELAIANYLQEKRDYPSSFNDLRIEYPGNDVSCDTQKLNEDGSIYLSGCSVNGTEVVDSSTDDGYYHYGKSQNQYKSYKIGDTVTYKGINFYVIEASDETSDRVTLLKAEPLTTAEMGSSIQSTEIANYVGSDEKYLTIPYLISEACSSAGVSDGTATGCTTDYNVSSVKQIIDTWANHKFKPSILREDNLGYKTRLLTFEEITANFGYEWGQVNPSTIGFHKTENTPSWIYGEYSYWTMSAYEDYPSLVWSVKYGGNVENSYVYNTSVTIRPVITLLKSIL